jgi:hypothetical protein
MVGTALLLAGVLAGTAWGSGPGAAAAGTLGTAVLVPGTIFVANGGDNGQGANGTGPGSITVYPPGSTGDVRPEAVITKGIDNVGVAWPLTFPVTCG